MVRSELGKWERIKTRGGRQKELVTALKFRVWELEAAVSKCDGGTDCPNYTFAEDPAQYLELAN